MDTPAKTLPANPAGALRAALPPALAQVPLLLAVGWLKLHPDFACAELPGVNGGTFALLTVSYLLPLSVLCLLLPLIALGRHILQSGESPPPGTPVWRDTPVRTGAAARRRGWLLLALAPLAAVLVVLGGKLWDDFARGRSLAEMDTHFRAQCAAGANASSRRD